MNLPENSTHWLAVILQFLRAEGHIPIAWIIEHPNLMDEAWRHSDDSAEMAECLRLAKRINGDRVWWIDRQSAVQLDEREGRYRYACVIFSPDNDKYFAYLDGDYINLTMAQGACRVADRIRDEFPVPPTIGRLLESARDAQA